MKKVLTIISAVLIVLPLLFLTNVSRREKDSKFQPGDWFYYQRAYPHNYLPAEKYFEAVKKYSDMKLEKGTFNNNWLPVGPSNIGGRITALCVDPGNTDIIYAGAAAGGIFKTTDGGANWEPKTDNFPSLSTGALCMDPNNSSVIYCGTGEANISTDSYPGFGLLKSTDQGETWNLSGLENSRHIGQIQVHPLNSNIVYVAVSGGLYSKDTTRGIYKSTDAGGSWRRMLFVNDSTAAIDVDVDPTDLNIVYAAFWERQRSTTYRKASGVSSAVYKSTDGGETWNKLTAGLPSNDPVIGRISLAVSKSNPNYVYALVKQAEAAYGTTNVFYGFYKSTNKGVSWTRMPDGILPNEFSNFGWYFGLLYVDPLDHNKVYLGEVDLLRTTDGGSTWNNVTNSYSGTFDMQHPDQHSLWINPSNTNHIVNGNDGGVFISSNGGTAWTKSYDLPVSQFYAFTVAKQSSDFVMGGTQDNGTMLTKTGSYDNWLDVYGGDGFHCQIDYNNSNYIYAEYQWGGLGRSTNGGNSFLSATSGLDLSRTNWSSPYILDPRNPMILYFGSYKLHRTTNRGQNWTAISQDLTRGPNGRLGTITCISAAVASNQTDRVLYVGTDDAKVSVSTNSGGNWSDVTGSLPNRYVTDIAADTNNSAVAYVTLSGFSRDLKTPHIFRTTDFGGTWTDISSNLPDIPINAVVIDYNKDSVLYVGADAGVYYSTNLGVSWNALGEGLPNAPVFDLNFHKASQMLFAATHGRSIFKIDVSNIATILNDENIISEYSLSNNYPNPFNPSTEIRYSLAEGGKVKLTVYDISGKEIAVLVNREEAAGDHRISFAANNLAAGIYFYKIEVNRFSQVKKMVLLK